MSSNDKFHNYRTIEESKNFKALVKKWLLRTRISQGFSPVTLFRPLWCVGIVLIFIFPSLGLHAQNNLKGFSPITHTHRNYKTAINLLQQSKARLPSDSLLFQNELQTVKNEYKAFADSLKAYAPASHYASFETQRLINLCYAAQSIQELKNEQNKLFEHLAAYHTHMPEQDSVNEEIAKCIVNSYETQSIWFEDSLLHHVTSAMKQHMQSLQSWTWLPAQTQTFVDMYAAQYYKRGIISLAEPVFRRFRDVFSQQKKTTETTAPTWSVDYPILSAKLASTGKKLSYLNGQRIEIIANSESPFHLIYMIVQLRTADRAYPNIPVCIFRNPATVSDSYLHALKRNLAISDYYIIDLNTEDSSNTDDFPCCYFLTESGNLKYATNNPIDFLEWLEKPLKSQMEAKKEQLHENYRKLQEKRAEIAALPEDTTIKFKTAAGSVNISFRGYWDHQPDIKIKQYNFTESNYADLSENNQLASLEFFIDNNPIYSLDFIPAGEKIEIDLIADPRHNINAKFSDKTNQNYYDASKSLDSLLFIKDIYDNLLENYPFASSDFIQEVQERVYNTQYRLTKIIDTSDPILKALISIKRDALKLLALQPDSSIQMDDFRKSFPFEAFDSIIWKSPYYKAWLDAWLNYGRLDLKNAIDMLYSSWKTIPDTAGTLVSEYLWDKMNSMGRFDIMVHLDTTWLAGCSDIKDIDVLKRIEGYKRMAPGKKAPNITWQENGAKKDLYGIEADTIIVVFWSDECAHCIKTLPDMYAKLSSRKDIEVVAIAVDTDKSSLQTGKKHMPAWHHVWAKDGWKDDLIELYNIFGTPEMYVLDEKCEIIRKQTIYP